MPRDSLRHATARSACSFYLGEAPLQQILNLPDLLNVIRHARGHRRHHRSVWWMRTNLSCMKCTLVRLEAQIAVSLSIRPTSRAAGKEGRLAPTAQPPPPAAAPRASPDRNVLMYLRTGSAGPTQPAARIVGRPRLRESGSHYLPLKSSQAKRAPITTAPAMIPNRTPRGITCDRAG
jgi:hypothetical protein